jgi:glycosyltransferase involved in cell wall biosynthesis
MWQRFSEPMNLLFVHECFGALGGAEANILSTARGLQKLGHSVGILHGSSTQNQEAAWLETFLLRYPLGEPADPDHVRQVVDAFQPDVIYVHKMRHLKVLQALAASGMPVIRMVHDHDLYCMRSYKYNYFTRRICERRASLFCVVPCAAFVARNPGGSPPIKWISYAAKRDELRWNRRFERLIVATRFMKEQLLSNGFSEKRIEIHPPVPDGQGPCRISSFDERNRIVFAGQLIRGKGVDLLLDVLARIQAPFECFIFGEGNHRAFCEQKSAQLGLSDRVHFQGHVSRDVISQCYADASVAVVSSVWPEPFGAVGLEAMQYGLPVVAFDAGGIKEWLIDGHNGYLVPWRDCSAFAGRVEELLRDKPLAQRLGQNGRKLVTNGYSFSNYIGGLEDLFQRVSRQTPRPMVPAC